MSNDQSALADWERDLLAAIGTGPIVVLGVGNRDKGDDGVGSVVAGELSHQLSVISPATASKNQRPHSLITAVLDCGSAPENYLSRVAGMHPRHVVFIDAADFGVPPGSIRLFKVSSQLTTDDWPPIAAVSTHSAGLELSAQFLRTACRSFDEAQDRPYGELTCWLLAVQPGQLQTGTALSPPVREGAGAIVSSRVWQRSAPSRQA